MLVLTRRDGEQIDITTAAGHQANIKRIGERQAKFAVAGTGCQIVFKQTADNFTVLDLKVNDEFTIVFPCGEQVDVACLYVGRQAKLGFNSQSKETVVMRHELTTRQVAG